MSIADQLRDLAGAEVAVDADAGLAQVRRRARTTRRRRAAVRVLAVVLAAGGGLVVADLTDGEQVETVPAAEPVPHYLPYWVPEGFTLAWYDAPAVRSSRSEGYWPDRWYDRGFGYHHPVDGGVLELELKVYWGAELGDPDSEMARLGDGAVAMTVGGRPAFGLVGGDFPQLVAEVEGAVVELRVIDLWDSSTSDGPELPLPLEELQRFIASIRPVPDDIWRDRVSGADVASRFTLLDTEPLIEGDGWTIARGNHRAPLSVRHPAVGLVFDDGYSSSRSSGTWPGGAVDASIDLRAGVQVAWGTMPPGTTRVVIDSDDASYETTRIVPVGDVAVFAIDVTGVESERWELSAYGPDGEPIARREPVMVNED